MSASGLPNGSAYDEQPSELTLRHLWEVAKRRRKLVLRATIATCALALILGLASTRKYESRGEIQLQKDSSDALGLDSMMSGSAAAESDALDATVTLQTEAKIMESQTLALTVIDRLHLDREEDFKPKFSLIGWMLGFISPKGPADPAGRPLLQSPKKRDQLLGVFKTHTKVAPVSGTRLIDISYTSTNPRLAAAVVNQMIEGLVDYNFQTRYEATSQTSDWLSKQLSELRSTSDDLQKQVADLQRSSGVLSFGDEDLAGKGTVYSTVLDQLQQATVNLTQAESNRILRGAVYQAAKSGNPESIATLVTSGAASGGSASVGQSLALLQGFRAQEAAQKAQISEMSEKFGPAYTRLDEMQANLNSIESSIKQEKERLGAQAKSDYEIATEVEDRTRTTFDEQKKSAESLNDKAIQYQLLRQEADQSRDLYSKLQSRLKEAGVLEGLRSSNITIVEPGRVPSRPSSPNIMLLLVGALFGGPMLGLGCVFIAEMTDHTVNDPPSLAARFGHAYLGAIPMDLAKPSKRSGNPARELFTIARPQSAFSEGLRSLRTALLLGVDSTPPRVVLITSPGSEEGKSTLSANLAVQLAQMGKRVLLIDADLRRGHLHWLLNTGESGLSECLSGKSSIESSIKLISNIEGLSFIACGERPTQPSELLGSDGMPALLSHARRSFDFVLIDAAALLSVTDALLLAAQADKVVVVARCGQTDSADLDRAVALLQARAPRTSIGVVVTAVTQSAPGYPKLIAAAHLPSDERKGRLLHA